MRTTTISAILILVLGSMANGAEWLTINGEDVASIDLTLGQSCTIEVVSDGGGLPYIEKLHTINFTLSDLELIEITPEAGTGASVAPSGDNAYRLTAGTGMAAGVHFVFSFTATSAGQKEVELTALLGGDPFDSIVINVASAPAGTAFTYQGILKDGDSAADGEYDFEFKLYNSLIAGDQVGSTVNKEDVSVDQGHFTVKLDFLNDPNVFNGQARWLEIGVRPGNAISSFIPLSPRQELTPSPYAIYAVNGGSDNGWTISGNNMYSDVSGNVGIGTQNPQEILDVNGTVKGTNSVHAGYGVHGKTTSYGFGVYGKSEHSWGRGVYGSNIDGSWGYIGGDHGVYGKGDGGAYSYGGYFNGSSEGVGVWAENSKYGNSAYLGTTAYAGNFHGDVYITKNCSAESFTDRTPYPKTLEIAYEAVFSMQPLPHGQYNESNKEQQLDHSKLSDFVRSEDGNRDLSATVSCHNEVLKDLIRKQQELSEAHTYIEQLQKQNELLEARLVKLESLIANKTLK